MGSSTQTYGSLPDPKRDIEIEEHILNAPDPEIPNLENWDDQDIDFVEVLTKKQKYWQD